MSQNLPKCPKNFQKYNQSLIHWKSFYFCLPPRFSDLPTVLISISFHSVAKSSGQQITLQTVLVIVCFIGNLGFSLSLLLKYDKFASTINCLKSSNNGFFHNYFCPIKIINFPTSFRNIFTGQEKSDRPNTLSNFHTLLLDLVWDEMIFNFLIQFKLA